MSRRPNIAEIGYWLIERSRGRGSRAVALLSRWAVTKAQFARVEALVELDNFAAQRRRRPTSVGKDAYGHSFSSTTGAATR
jgi:hypothetical protein